MLQNGVRTCPHQTRGLLRTGVEFQTGAPRPTSGLVNHTGGCLRQGLCVRGGESASFPTQQVEAPPPSLKLLAHRGREGPRGLTYGGMRCFLPLRSAGSVGSKHPRIWGLGSPSCVARSWSWPLLWQSRTGLTEPEAGPARGRSSEFGFCQGQWGFAHLIFPRDHGSQAPIFHQPH